MNSGEDADIRWQQRFANYKKAHARLKQTAAFFDEKSGTGVEGDVAVEALIKCFEFTFELAWQTMKDYISYKGYVKEIYGSRDSIRAAVEFAIVEEGQVWIEMVDDRNRAVHAYDARNALDLAHRVAERYRAEFIKFEAQMEAFV